MAHVDNRIWEIYNLFIPTYIYINRKFFSHGIINRTMHKIRGNDQRNFFVSCFTVGGKHFHKMDYEIILVFDSIHDIYITTTWNQCY